VARQGGPLHKKGPWTPGEGDSDQAAPERRPTLTEDLQQAAGNHRLDETLRRGDPDGHDLYLRDLCAVAQETGHDLSPWTPWNAAPSWTAFVAPWYRVIAAEEARAPAPAAAVDGPSLQRHAPGATDLSQLDLADWYQDLVQRTGAGRSLRPLEQDVVAAGAGRPVPEARIHEGPLAAQAAADIGARAFAVGTDIYLGAAANPAHPEGAELLAHEAMHVRQHLEGRDRGLQGISDPGSPLEREADAAGARAAAAADARAADWGFRAPELPGPEGRALVAFIRRRLPTRPASPPPALVQEGLFKVLAQQLQVRLGDLRESLAPDSGGPGDADLTRHALALAETAARRALTFDELSPDTLRRLAAVAGAPGAEALLQLQATFAPYPNFAAAVSRLLSDLAHTPPATPGERLLAEGAEALPSIVSPPHLPDPTGVHDDDPARAALTGALLARYSRDLGLDPGRLQVHTDLEGQRRTVSLGTRGLAEGRHIYLDPDRYDPQRAEGRGLLAHELTHVAQDSLTAPVAVTGLGAEAEAGVAAEQAARGGSLAPATLAMPVGHVAAEGPLQNPAAQLQTIQDNLQSTLGPQSESMGEQVQSLRDAAPTNRPQNATQDRDEKMDQYEDGVDGIADQIGDTDAFDDLCEAIDDDQSTAGPLSRIKSSDNYDRLADMWKGALEGEEDQSRMQSLFNSEFDGRGFWAETEQAFDMVCRDAKREGQQRQAADATRGELEQARQEGEQIVSEEGADQSGEDGGAEQAEAGAGPECAPGDPSLAALMHAEVTEFPDPLSNFNQLQQNQSTFDLVAGEVGHQETFVNGLQSDAGTDFSSKMSSRWDEIGNEVWRGVAGGFVQGASDQFLDTLVWDSLGKVGDMGVAALSRGRLGTQEFPVVGPAITLVQNGLMGDVLSGDPFSGQYAQGLADQWGGIGGTYDQMSGKLDMLAGASGTDLAGLLISIAADWVTMGRDALDLLVNVLSTASAVCYVVGAICVVFGLALSWCGMGWLVTVGTWLFRVGRILGRIVDVLEPIVRLLSALAFLLRTASAFLVPADIYAQELGAVGEASETFGTKFGEYAGEQAGEAAQDWVGGAIRPDAPDAGTPDADAQAEGQPAGEGTVEAAEGTLDNTADNVSTELDNASSANDDAVAEVAASEAEAAERTDDAPAQDAPAETPPETTPDESDTPADADPDRTPDSDSDPDRSPSAEQNQKTFKDILIGSIWPNRQARADLMDDLGAFKDQLRSDFDPQAQRARLAEIVGEFDQARQDVDRLQGALNDLMADSSGGPAEQAAIDSIRAQLAQAETVKSMLGRDVEVARSWLNVISSDGAEESVTRDPLSSEPGDGAANRLDSDSADDTRRQELDESLPDLEQEALDRRQQADDDKTEADRLQQEVEAERTRQEEQAAQDQRNQEARDAADAASAEQARLLREADAAKREADVEIPQRTDEAKGQFVDQQVTIGSGDDAVSGRVVEAQDSGVIYADQDGNCHYVDWNQVSVPEQLAEHRDYITDGSKQDHDAAWARYVEASTHAHEMNLTPLGASTVDASASQDAADATAEQADGPTDGENGTLEERAAAAQTQATQSAAAADAAEQNHTDAQDELRQVEERLLSTPYPVQHERDRAAPADEGEGGVRNWLADNVFNSDVTSSGNAMGGVGSSYRELLEGMADGSFQEQLARIGRAIAPGVSADPSPQTQAQQNLQRDQAVLNTSEEDLLNHRPEESTLQQISGSLTAAGEFLRSGVNLAGSPSVQHMVQAPPKDMETMGRVRQEAEAAAAQYAVEHAMAYRAYLAEIRMQVSVDEGNALLEGEGRPVQEAAEAAAGPIAEGQQQASQRAATLAGAEPGTQPADPAVASETAAAGGKMDEGAEAQDEQASSGDMSAMGSESASAQDAVNESANTSTSASQDASSQEQEALTQLSTTQQDLASGVGDANSQLEAKIGQNDCVLQDIQTTKATHLSQRDAAGATAEEKAGAYNADLMEMATWAATYRQHRVQYEAGQGN